MKKKFALLVVVAGLFMVAACNGNAKSKQQATKTATHQKVIYTCTMHPQVISDKPGNCPICGMTLVKKTVSDTVKITVPKK
jgi:Cu(I)/Ag(I) efflux system membrane fusion protein